MIKNEPKTATIVLFYYLCVCVCEKNIPIGNWNSDLLMHFSNIFSYLGDPISKRTT